MTVPAVQQSAEPYASMSANIDLIPSPVDSAIWEEVERLIEAEFNNRKLQGTLPKRVMDARLWVKNGVIPNDPENLLLLHKAFVAALERHGVRVYDTDPCAVVLHESAQTMVPVELVLEECHIISARRMKGMTESMRKLGRQMIECADMLDKERSS